LLSGDDTANPARLFESFAPFSGLLLAVSGGPDSMALLRLAAAWRDAATPPPKLAAATVDHGLRAEAASEAAKVSQWSQALGIPHRILVWTGEKPTTGIQARARSARYRLLLDHMREIEATALATAHHADDQWETLMIRLSRGSGIAGLAAMSRDRDFLGERLIRPLLHLPKATLIAYCRRCGQDFCDDPSNADQRFTRSQWRELAAPLHRLGFTRERAAKLAERAEKCDRALEWAALRFLDDIKIPTESHAYDLSRAENVPTAILEHFLQSALAKVSGDPASRLERLERLAARLRTALRAETELFATLGGCTVALTGDKRLRIGLEVQRRRGR
jgi:tRNA(Ile)-lysidine synthase